MFYYKLDRLFFASLIRPIKDFGAWIRQQAKARTNLGNAVAQKDCFHYMLNAKDPNTGRPFTERELWTESLELIVAGMIHLHFAFLMCHHSYKRLGSDTVAIATSSTLFHLVHNPAALNKLTEEIRSCFESEQDIRLGAQLNSCSFLRACITEALRLSPPFAGIPPRRVLAGGITVDGHYFPEGVVIGTPIYTIHHDQRYYPRPFRYEPERWLEQECDSGYEPREKAGINLARSALCPFSIGPRSCVAKNLAWAELSLVLARVMFKYDMRLPAEHVADEPGCCGLSGSDPDKSPEYQLKAWISAGRKGPLIQFRPRMVSG